MVWQRGSLFESQSRRIGEAGIFPPTPRFFDSPSPIIVHGSTGPYLHRATGFGITGLIGFCIVTRGWRWMLVDATKKVKGVQEVLIFGKTRG